MKISARKRATKRIQRYFCSDMILDSNESAIFALVIKTVYIKMAKISGPIWPMKRYIFQSKMMESCSMILKFSYSIIHI